MKKLLHITGLALMFGMLIILSNPALSFEGSNSEDAEKAPEKGPHNGRLLKDGDFVLELAIFETGVPPEFRVWVSNKGEQLQPTDVDLKITLTRLGGAEDKINFTPQGDFLRGDMVIYEPHSFVVSINANYQGQLHHWQYDNLEGRTSIESAVAEALEIGTSIAGPQVLKETVSAFGKLANHPEKTRHVTARFAGAIKKVHVSLGQRIKKGQRLVTIESNESLKSYTIFAPIDGVIAQRNANPGEQTKDRVLFTLADSRLLVSELAVFPSDRQRMKIGAKVWLSSKGNDSPIAGVITQIDTLVQANQSIIVRAELENEAGNLLAGTFVTAKIEVAEYHVPLAVKRSGLQAFRDFTVVFEKIGNEYEVRMLELGRVAGEWVEVLGGLKAGAQYVSDNSYIIKADIEKSGASHDH